MPDKRRFSVTAGARSAIVVVGLVLAAGLAVLFGTRDKAEGEGPVGSSFATSDRGAKAAYLLLARLGHQVERRALPLGDLGPSRLVFLLAPQTRLDEVKGTALRRWLEAGGTLVYGIDALEAANAPPGKTPRLPQARALPIPPTTGPLDEEWRPARALSLRARILMDPGGDRENDDEDDDDIGEANSSRPDSAQPFVKANSASAGFVLPQGKGRIYLIDARVFSNEGLKAGDNALFLAVLAARYAASAPIVFDEHVHGFGNVPSLITAVAWPLKAAVVLFGLALVIYALALGRRLGPAAPEPQPPRRASLEQIESLAAYFAVDKDRQTARQTALAALASALEQPVPMPPPHDDRGLLAAAQTLMAGRPADLRPQSPNKGQVWPSTEFPSP